MKTAEEKAKEFMDKLEDFPSVEIYRTQAFNDITKAVIKLLKEQDRDTRHACAEALAFMDDNEDHDVIVGNAIRICMNVKAV